MPKTFKGLFTWLLGTIIVVAVGMAIITRVPPLARLVLRANG